MSDLPEAPLLAPASTGPTCSAKGCGSSDRMGQWLRRLTADEYADELALAQARWDEKFLLRNIQLPDPVQPPMPGPEAFTRSVLACGLHAIGHGGAAHIHQATCSGPDSPALPHCDCTPEPLPPPDPEPESQAPLHWLADMAGSD